MIASFLSALLAKTISPPSWKRTNFAGEQTTLAGGIPAVAGSCVAALRSPAAFVSVGAASVAGWADDHLEHDSTIKGLSGHLSALKAGKVTTGAAKIAIIGGGAVVSSLMIKGRNPIVSTVVIAGTANLVNLLDLRPGRALKAVGALSGAIALTSPFSTSSRLAMSNLGTILACWDDDIQGRTMLGDMGANALGAVTGVALASHRSPKVASISAVVVTGLILASEKVSFSQVIEQNEILHRLDRWGRE